MTRHRVQRSAARGFTLIEALVALVVLSIGLLGVAGMQIAGLRANMSAASRTQASYLAADIVDRMRANNTNARSGSYNVGMGATLTGTSTAQTDVQTWVTELATLPSGQGSITVDPTTNIATVVIQWVDSRGGDSSACTGVNLDSCSPISFTTVTQL
ncbi:MAG: type IV pilus modification protein PilV [Proteobacteria bacterium]|nr:type IV pilus modification protein PilV [Pseudomonadota bacterium]